jgi:hypothetical protein
MRTIVVALAALLSPTLWAVDDCTFDQDHQVKVLTAIAQSEPGASLNLESREVSWGAVWTDHTVFAYGGCEDLGSTVTRTTPMKAPRTQEQVFALAKALAERFWSNQYVVERQATETLVSGLAGQRFEIEHWNGTTTYSIRDPHYVELYVEHSYSDGADRVSIAWQGNF